MYWNGFLLIPGFIKTQNQDESYCLNYIWNIKPTCNFKIAITQLCNCNYVADKHTHTHETDPLDGTASGWEAAHRSRVSLMSVVQHFFSANNQSKWTKGRMLGQSNVSEGGSLPHTPPSLTGAKPGLLITGSPARVCSVSTYDMQPSTHQFHSAEKDSVTNSSAGRRQSFSHWDHLRATFSGCAEDHFPSGQPFELLMWASVLRHIL